MVHVRCWFCRGAGWIGGCWWHLCAQTWGECPWLVMAAGDVLTHLPSGGAVLSIK